MNTEGQEEKMRIGIIACDVLKNEIEHLTRDDPDFVHREYLEFALHENPEEMKRVIIEHVNALDGSVDAVLLGYGICQSLENITEFLNVPSVMLPGADCIDALLGPEEYAAEKKKCTGTWFSSPGWAEQGVNGLIKELHLDSAEGYDPQFFLDILFESYERCLFIDPGIGNDEFYLQKSQEFANDLKLRLDCRTCSLNRLEESIAQVKHILDDRADS